MLAHPPESHENRCIVKGRGIDGHTGVMKKSLSGASFPAFAFLDMPRIDSTARERASRGIPRVPTGSSSQHANRAPRVKFSSHTNQLNSRHCTCSMSDPPEAGCQPNDPQCAPPQHFQGCTTTRLDMHHPKGQSSKRWVWWRLLMWRPLSCRRSKRPPCLRSSLP